MLHANMNGSNDIIHVNTEHTARTTLARYLCIAVAVAVVVVAAAAAAAGIVVDPT